MKSIKTVELKVFERPMESFVYRPTEPSSGNRCVQFWSPILQYIASQLRHSLLSIWTLNYWNQRLLRSNYNEYSSELSSEEMKLQSYFKSRKSLAEIGRYADCGSLHIQWYCVTPCVSLSLQLELGATVHGSNPGGMESAASYNRYASVKRPSWLYGSLCIAEPKIGSTHYCFKSKFRRFSTLFASQ